MTDGRAQATLEAAERISALLSEMGIRHAVIGAMAMAVHGYERATLDFDIGTVSDPFTQLTNVARRLEDLGYATTLTTPDGDDPLGGVLSVSGEGIDPIQLVNFYNPFAPTAGAVGREAIVAAQEPPGFRVAVVDLAHLVLLKLYAGGAGSRADIAGLLDANPHIDRDELALLAERHGLVDELKRALDET